MMQEQDLKEYYHTVYILKSGKQVEILCVDFPQCEVKIRRVDKEGLITIKGFIATPMIIEKTVTIKFNEIAAIETTKEPHITWKGTELDHSLSV